MSLDLDSYGEFVAGFGWFEVVSRCRPPVFGAAHVQHESFLCCCGAAAFEL